MNYAVRDEDIAVIGMAGRFPKADTIAEFWQNLHAGRECINFFDDQELADAGVTHSIYNNPSYMKAKGILNNVEDFDPSFFGLSALEAKLLDPQHRLFLLCAWEAFEDAGCVPINIGRVGVFASTGISHYLLKNIITNPELLANIDEYQLMLSHDKDFLATRLSYLLNLQGPSINIQTGCSSSLVGVHYACQSLLNGECELALAGGVSITLPQKQGYLYKKEMIGSPDGHCYAFDERAQGTVKSNGVGVVLLKPLADALQNNDHIYAVIRGSAVNNDGANKVGYTAPSVSQQAAVIREALAVADCSPATIEYIETHGTGTILGDPIEISALKQAFAQKNVDQPRCALASVKTNLGHLDIAAGVTSLIKACLAIYFGKIPASLNFAKLNPKIDLTNTPFYINTELKDWNSKNCLRRAGVSAFGVGGTNAHVVLQQSPPMPSSRHEYRSYLLLFSAKSKYSLQKNVENIKNFIKKNPSVDLSDIAYTLQVGRQHMPYRIALMINDRDDFDKQLASITFDQVSPIPHVQPNIVFMFSGQGSQYPGMAFDLYQAEPVFKKAFDQCLIAFKPHLTFDLKQLIFPEDFKDSAAQQRLKQTEVAQAALFTVEYALATCFLSYGIKPKAVLGHSIGEYVAAVLAEIFSLEDAAFLIAMRGRLIQKLPNGSMLAVHMDRQKLLTILPSTLDIAAENAPQLTVVSGTSEAINNFIQYLEQQHIRYQCLHTSHAFHSRLMDSILQEFSAAVANTRRRAPQLLIASNVTGDWLTTAQACSVDYWVQQLRQTVKFSTCITTLERQLAPIFIELGPGRTLQSLVYQQGIKKSVNSLCHPSEDNNNFATFYRALGQLWTYGADLQPIYKAKRIPLPTYHWDLQRYWFDMPQNNISKTYIIENSTTRKNVVNITETVKEIWYAVLGASPTAVEDNFFTMGGNSLTAIQLIERLPVNLQNRVNVIHLYQYPKFSHFINFLESLMQTDNNRTNLDDNNDEHQLFTSGEEI